MLLPVILLLIIIAIAFIVIFNQLTRHRILTQEAQGGISAGLQERHDLVPNLVETVKGYIGHESKTLIEVTKWRNQGLAATTVEEQAEAARGLNQALQQMSVVAENYPELKADGHFLELMTQLSRIENKLNDARRYYNGTVRNYNQHVLVFPKNLVASLFGFKLAPFFAEEAAAAKPPAVNFQQADNEKK